MIKEKLKLIEEISASELITRHILVYSILLTFSFEELCKILKENYMLLKTRDRILQHLVKNHMDKNYEELLSFFVTKYIISKGREKQSIGRILRILKEQLSDQEKRILFKRDLYSNLISERNRAYSFASSIYDDEIKKALENSWKQYRDSKIIEIFLEKENIKFFKNNFENLWEDSEISNYTKNRIVNLLGKHWSEFLEIIKTKNLISYLSASVYAKNFAVKKDVKSIMQSAKSMKEISYCIWCLGKLGLYEEIKDVYSSLSFMDSLIERK